MPDPQSQCNDSVSDNMQLTPLNVCLRVFINGKYILQNGLGPILRFCKSTDNPVLTTPTIAIANNSSSNTFTCDAVPGTVQTLVFSQYGQTQTWENCDYGDVYAVPVTQMSIYSNQSYLVSYYTRDIGGVNNMFHNEDTRSNVGSYVLTNTPSSCTSNEVWSANPCLITDNALSGSPGKIYSLYQIATQDFPKIVTNYTFNLVGYLPTQAATVICYWGTNDGGTTVSAWMTNTVMGLKTAPVSFTNRLGGVTQGTTYFFRYWASNDVDAAWASNTLAFSTPDAIPSIPAGYGFMTNSDNTITIIGYTNSDSVVTIPSSINGLPVTCIGGGAFFHCYGLTSMIIPSSVTNIVYRSIEACSSLTNITVDSGNSVYSSIDGVLFDASQTTLIGYPVGKIGDYAIPNTVAFIGDSAFDYSILTSVTIDANVSTIGKFAFANCSNLTALYCHGNAFSLGDSRDAIFTFIGDGNVTVYYLLGTTGWDSFAGPSPVLWNPQVQTDATFGPQANCFGFTFTNAGSPAVVVTASTDLTSSVWIPVATNTLTSGSSYFSDPQWTNYPNRYYRFQMP